MVILLLSTFVFFLSHVVPVVDIWLCLVLLLHPIYLCSSFMVNGMGLLCLPHFCPSFALSWACGLAVAISCWIGPLGLISFSSFFYAFTSLYFLPLLTNIFLHSVFACYWAFLLLSSFYQKQVSTKV